MGYSGTLNWIVNRPIAHRGLHDGNRSVPENSLSAAFAAIAGGYAIECDVQLSADGTPHVFHDDTLSRLAGDDRAFRAVSDAELARLKLAGTSEAIPTVEAFLHHVAGRAPIVMEMKGLSSAADGDYVPRLASVLASYGGDLALMSFDEWLIDAALAARLPRPVGLTAEGSAPGVLAAHRRVFEKGCAFCSYNVKHLPNGFCEWVRAERAAPLISWTVRSETEAEHSALHADQVTFEGFAPQH